MTDTATVTPEKTFVRRGPITLEQLHRQPTISVEQAADLLGISRAHGYRMIRTGQLDAIALGLRRVRVKSSTLLRMFGEG